MNADEKSLVSSHVDALIGSYGDLDRRIESLPLAERIYARSQYGRLREKLYRIAENGGIKSLQLTLISSGIDKRGITPSGKTVLWCGNNGMTERSRYCGTLIIDGKTIFTSGTVARALEYIINN